jgi:hypothetical protein
LPQRLAWLVQGHVTAREGTPCAFGVKFGKAMARKRAEAHKDEEENTVTALIITTPSVCDTHATLVAKT